MYFLIAILLCSLYGFYIGKKKSLSLVDKGNAKLLTAKPNYHGYYIFFWCFEICAIYLFCKTFTQGNYSSCT